MRQILILLTIGLQLASIIPDLAQNINGIYKYEGPIWSGEIILMNNVFEMRKGINLNHTVYLSKGYYLILKDTLILFHQKLKVPPGSSFELMSHIEIDGTTILSFEVVDEDNRPMVGVSVNFYSKDRRILFTLLTDTDGKIENVCLDRLSEISQVEFGFIGYQSLNINLIDIRNGSFKFKILLRRDNGVTYNVVERTEKYLINKTKTSLQLLGIKDEVVIYSKMLK
jgi:hypothetical protein